MERIYKVIFYFVMFLIALMFIGTLKADEYKIYSAECSRIINKTENQNVNPEYIDK